jgi:hypothetical protein
MTRAIFALALLIGFCGTAAAQGCGQGNPNCVAPTPPVGDNSNRIATTAFVSGGGGGVVPVAPQAGGDLGAKINNAIALLPANGGILDATGISGTVNLSTAVVIPANTQLRMGVTVVVQSAIITLGQVSSLVCPSVGIGQGNNFGQTRFIEANSANLAEMVLVSGGQASVSGCIFDGNQTNNSTAGPNINVTGSHALLKDITTQNARGAGWQIFSTTGSPNTAAVGTAYNVVSVANFGDGLFCANNHDWIISDSSFENNAGAAGLELQNCGALRLVNYDFGANVIGIWGYGTGGGGGTTNMIIGHGQFGGQSAQDILLDGSTGTNNGSHAIVGAYFLGSANRPNNTVAAIDIHDDSVSGSILSGLIIVGCCAGHLPSNAINLHGAEATDMVGSIFAHGTFGGTVFNLANAFADSVCSDTPSQCLQNFSFGTGSFQEIIGNSANSGGANQFVAANSGTASNAGTQAALLASLSAAANAFVILQATGGATPTGLLQSAVGLTGGLTISTLAGPLTVVNPTLSNALISGGTRPTFSGTCAVTGQTGGAIAGTWTASGACAAGTYIATFGFTAPTGWSCNARDRTTPADAVNQTAASTTTATFTATTANNDVVQFDCTAY